MSDEIQAAIPDALSTLGAGAAAPRPPNGESVVMDRLLSMADHCMRDRQLRQAREMFFEILDRPGAADSEMEHARRCLMEIAQHYERTGNPHQARGIYEQLL